MNSELLTFISNDKLTLEVKRVLDLANRAEELSEKNFYSNTIDPFSAVFDSMRQDISLSEWIEQEKGRQVQKTMQNALGEFHQRVIGAIPGWESLSTGSVIDVRNTSKKIIGEIKNKHNTTKGSDKKVLYDNLSHTLNTSEYAGYTAYYVEIVPKGRKLYNNPFVPSDNVTKSRRPINESIRVIDGRTFYDIATGEKDALKKLYSAIPLVISQINGIPATRALEDKLFHELFDSAY